MPLAGAAANCNLTYLKLPNWHVNVKYDFSLSLKLWWPEFVFISIRYFAYASLGSVLLATGPVCTGLIGPDLGMCIWH